VFGYCRIDRAASDDSLATQRHQITSYARTKGWRIKKDAFFVDTGVSGLAPLTERQKGHRLLAVAKKGDVIITARFDRAFRSATDALGTLKELKQHGIALHTIDVGADVCGGSHSKLVLTILSAVAENKRDRIGERVRDVKRHLASQGVYSGGKRPFGFNIVDNVLVTNANEQAAISLMRTMRATDKSFREVAAVIKTEFNTDLLPMTIKRILDRIEKSRSP
jgi:putative DNA-invertase from lambdoid prophage Rac